jgi:hypothetical protein
LLLNSCGKTHCKMSALLIAHENKTCIHFHVKYTLSVMVEGVPVPRF